MIQRIQTIWLLLAGLVILLMWFLPLATTGAGATEYKAFLGGVYHTVNGATVKTTAFMPLIISAAAIVVLCIFSIFMFRNRAAQKRMVTICSVLLIGFSFFCTINAQKIPGGLDTTSMRLGIFLPLVAIVCCLLALRGINKDESLIRSADRLR